MIIAIRLATTDRSTIEASSDGPPTPNRAVPTRRASSGALVAEAGGAGCILPDLPVQESALWREHAEKHALATVFVVAPSSRDARLAEITAAGS